MLYTKKQRPQQQVSPCNQKHKYFFKRARNDFRPNGPFLPYHIETIKNKKGPGNEINNEQDFIFSF